MKIKCCPKCKSDNIHVRNINYMFSNTALWAAVCDDCHTRGLGAMSKADAVKEWNKGEIA